MAGDKSRSVFREPDNLNVKIWRYIDFTKFVSLLDLKALYFPRSDLLGDPFEGAMPRDNFRFYSLLYGTPPITPEGLQEISQLRQELRKRVYINCWHMNERESFAMWNLYYFLRGKNNTFSGRFLYGNRLILCIALGISMFCMNQPQTFSVRKFSALSRIIPALIPITSLSTQFVFGLNASTNPNFP